MKDICLVIGGCRSGKSGFAIAVAEKTNARRQVFVATGRPDDEEMRLRIEKHRRERGDRWTTIEEPLALPEAIDRHASPESIVGVDCLTLWVSNLLLTMTQDRPEETAARFVQLVHALRTARGPVVLVSNEVGTGVVPQNRLARQFRDAAGLVNQQVAAVATTVFWTVAGIPVKIK